MTTGPQHTEADQRRARLTGIAPDVRCGAVICLPRRDREISQRLYGHAAGGVGALYRRLHPDPVHFQSGVAAGHDADHAAVPAAWALGDAARLDRDEFSRLPLSATRSGARDPVLDAVHGRDPGRSAARRMDRLAALGGDPGRLCGRAAGDPAGDRRRALGRVLFAGERGVLLALHRRPPASCRAPIPATRHCSIPIWSARSRCCRCCHSCGRCRTIPSSFS